MRSRGMRMRSRGSSGTSNCLPLRPSPPFQRRAPQLIPDAQRVIQMLCCPASTAHRSCGAPPQNSSKCVSWDPGGGRGGGGAQYANYWAPLTRKRHIPPHPAQPQHTNYWAPRTRKRHQQEHRPQWPTDSSDPTQHAKGRPGDRPGPRKETTTRRNVTQGGFGPGTGPPSPPLPRPPPSPPPRAMGCIPWSAFPDHETLPAHSRPPAVSCGSPSQTHSDFSACTQHRYGGSCPVTCVAGYTGSPSATCTGGGQWVYGSQCSPGPFPPSSLALPWLFPCIVRYTGFVPVQCDPRSCLRLLQNCTDGDGGEGGRLAPDVCHGGRSGGGHARALSGGGPAASRALLRPVSAAHHFRGGDDGNRHAHICRRQRQSSGAREPCGARLGAIVMDHWKLLLL